MNRRFFCEHIPEKGGTVELCEGESYHVRTVLRGALGEHLVLLDGQGIIAEAEVTAGHDRRRGPISVHILSRMTLKAPSRRITLCVAPPKPKLMSLLVKQATELGVSRIQPILTERTTHAKVDEKALEGLRVDVREACKQSGNAWLPEVLTAAPLGKVLDRMSPPALVGCAPVNDEGVSPEVLAEIASWRDLEASLWIGPEGGFTDGELSQILDWGATPFSIGDWILRVETAVVAGLTLMQAGRAR